MVSTAGLAESSLRAVSGLGWAGTGSKCVTIATVPPVPGYDFRPAVGRYR